MPMQDRFQSLRDAMNETQGRPRGLDALFGYGSCESDVELRSSDDRGTLTLSCYRPFYELRDGKLVGPLMLTTR